MEPTPATTPAIDAPEFFGNILFSFAAQVTAPLSLTAPAHDVVRRIYKYEPD
jgi:hypothetical protein